MIHFVFIPASSRPRPRYFFFARDDASTPPTFTVSAEIIPWASGPAATTRSPTFSALASTFFVPWVIFVLPSIITMISLPSAPLTIRFMPSTFVMFPITVLSFSCAREAAGTIMTSANRIAAIADLFMGVLLRFLYVDLRIMRMFVRRCGWRRVGVATLQELLLLFPRVQLGRRARVDVLHPGDFVLRQLRQMADEVHQMP